MAQRLGGDSRPRNLSTVTKIICEGLVTKEPAYEEAGIISYYCAECGELIRAGSIYNITATAGMGGTVTGGGI